MFRFLMCVYLIYAGIFPVAAELTENFALSPFTILKVNKQKNENKNLKPKLFRKIIDLIDKSPQKRISYRDYMKLALYDNDPGTEGGFFISEVDIGLSTDFDTFANYPVFAEALAKQLFDMWKKMAMPKLFNVVEMGAGTGKMAVNILKAVKNKYPALYKRLSYNIAEISPKLIKEQKKNISSAFRKAPVSWFSSTALNLSELIDIEGVFLSNELVDNLLIHRIKIENGVPREVYVTYKNGAFTDILGELSTAELKAYFKDKEILPEGIEIAVNMDVPVWQEEISKALKKGFVITIDYGGINSEEIAAMQNFSTSVWNVDTGDVDKIYSRTGSSDITTYVNFADIVRAGEEKGLKKEVYLSQKKFLWNLVLSGEKDLNPFIEEVLTNKEFKVLIQSKNINLTESLACLQDRENKSFTIDKKLFVLIDFYRSLLKLQKELNRDSALNRKSKAVAVFKRYYSRNYQEFERIYPTLASNINVPLKTIVNGDKKVNFRDILQRIKFINYQLRIYLPNLIKYQGALKELFKKKAFELIMNAV